MGLAKTKDRPMEAVEFLSNLLKKAGIHNFLMLGIGIIVLWLLISGIKKGLKKSSGDKEDESREKK